MDRTDGRIEVEAVLEPRLSMNIAAALTLQTLPFAGIVLAGRDDQYLFAVVYLGAVGLILTLIILTGESPSDVSSFATDLESLSVN
ncbi:hypothetical protein [Methylobacterium sp. Leaf111]|uniref:hypothetical protein n=1 Tax=Methylobacterium sp. Leaf111 TaxID=1736257 RepID=UPI001FCCFD54|nr:hypothetical protein [Methylobacterium sp. Leaf111]